MNLDIMSSCGPIVLRYWQFKKSNFIDYSENLIELTTNRVAIMMYSKLLQEKVRPRYFIGLTVQQVVEGIIQCYFDYFGDF